MSAGEAKDVNEALRAKVLLVHERLCKAYECPIPYFHTLDPLSELISSILSHRTRNADSGRAFKALRAAYADWAAVRDAPTADLERLIATVTWPELKAPRIQRILAEITRLRGELSLDFLGDMDVPRARAWLESLPGVGPKTSAATLSFSTLRKAALPVDSHHHRVAVRLALIPANVAVGPSHDLLADQLPVEWSAQQVYDNHEVMMLHGQRCCFHANPACERCPVLDLCPTGQDRLTLKVATQRAHDRGRSHGHQSPGRPEQATEKRVERPEPKRERQTKADGQGWLF
jgi:endonuclease-3